MSFNTRNLAPSAEEKTTKKEVEAMGCRFIEYRGEGKPVRGIPPASPGDIYFDVMEQPYSVWVCQQDSEWNQWMSMSESRKLQTSNKPGIYFVPFSETPRMGTHNWLRRLSPPDEVETGEADRYCRYTYQDHTGLRAWCEASPTATITRQSTVTWL